MPERQGNQKFYEFTDELLRLLEQIEAGPVGKLAKVHPDMSPGRLTAIVRNPESQLNGLRRVHYMQVRFEELAKPWVEIAHVWGISSAGELDRYIRTWDPSAIQGARNAIYELRARSIRQEGQEWAKQQREVAQLAKPEGKSEVTGGGKNGKKRGRPADSGDTDPELDAGITKLWDRGYRDGKYKSKAELAQVLREELPKKLQKKIPSGQTIDAVFVRQAIDRHRKR